MCIQLVKTFKCRHAEFGGCTGCENQENVSFCSVVKREYVHLPELCWMCLHPSGIQRVQHPCDIEAVQKLNAAQGWQISKGIQGGQYLNGVKTQMYPDGVPGGSWPRMEKGGILSFGGQAAWLPSGVQAQEGQYALNLERGQMPFVVQGGQHPTKLQEGFLVMGRRGPQLPDGAKGMIYLNPGKCPEPLNPVPINSYQDEDPKILREVQGPTPSRLGVNVAFRPVNWNQETPSMAAKSRHWDYHGMMNEKLPDGPGNLDKMSHEHPPGKENNSNKQKLNTISKPTIQSAQQVLAGEGIGNTRESPYVLE
jgi:hypothetical protein